MPALSLPTGAEIINTFIYGSGEKQLVATYDAAAIDAYIAANGGGSVVDTEFTYIKQVLVANGYDPDNLTATVHAIASRALRLFCAYQLIELALSTITAATKDEDKWVQRYTLIQRQRSIKSMGNNAMIDLGIIDTRYLISVHSETEFSVVDRIRDTIEIENYGKGD